MTATSTAHVPITPGEILLTEFLEPLGITQHHRSAAHEYPSLKALLRSAEEYDPLQWERFRSWRKGL